MDLKDHYGLMINKNKLSIDQLRHIRNSLTVIDELSDENTCFYYFEDEKYFYLPRLSYNINGLLSYINKDSIVRDKSIQIYENNKELFKNKKMLIEPRNEIQIDTMDFLMNSESMDKSLFLSPGTGKTALSIMYLVKKKLKALIILPDTNLINQWKESILEFSNITEDEIYIFKDGSKSINNKECNKNKLVFLACIKTFSSLLSKSSIEECKSYKEFIERCEIDIKIFDECHLNLNAIFKTTVWLPTYENLYLSGTMNRRLVKENNIHPGIIEPNHVIESVEYEITPQLLCLKYDSRPSHGHVKFCQDMNNRTGFDYNVYFNKYILAAKNVDKKNTYFEMIDNMCNYFINQDNRYDYKNKIIIVGFTIAFLDALYELLSTKYRVCRMYSKYKEKPDHEEFDIIIGTNKMLTAGFDKKSLNIMISTFMNTSSHNVKQLIGRICRSYPNKELVQYVCLVDTGFSMLNKYYRKHKEICENELSQKNQLEFKEKISNFKF